MQTQPAPEHIIVDFISPSECIPLLEHVLPHVTPLPGVLSSYGIKTIDFSALPRAVADQLSAVVPFTEKVIKENFPTNSSFAHRGGCMHAMPVGSFNPSHVDDAQPYPAPESDAIDAPTHVYKRHYSAVLMLNDDYEGGFLEFPNQDKKYRLNPGQVIVFKGDYDNPHQVSEVTKGTRINFVMFFTEDI
jgi:2OG-Fe(II) oxygenase superfamily